MPRKSFFVMAGLVLFCSYAFSTTQGLFAWDSLALFDLENPAMEPTWEIPVHGVCEEIILTPDKSKFLITYHFERHEGIGIPGPGYLLVDPCEPEKYREYRFPGIKDIYAETAQFSEDGKILYFRGCPDTGGFVSESARFTNFIVYCSTGTIINSFCARKVFCGGNGRIYYVPITDRNEPRPLMSRTERGDDEYVEIPDIDALEKGLVECVISSGKTQYLLIDPYESHFFIYTFSRNARPELLLTHPGRYISNEGSKILYKCASGDNYGMMDFLNPSDDKIITAYFATSPPPKDAEIKDLRISPDGKKHFFFYDPTVRQQVEYYFYDLETNRWSEKFTMPINGGSPGKVLISTSCSYTGPKRINYAPPPPAETSEKVPSAEAQKTPESTAPARASNK